MKKLFAPIPTSKKKEIWSWSKNLVERGNSYDRTNQPNQKRIENLFFGKVGEWCFYTALLLHDLLKPSSYENLMKDFLEVYEGESNGDNGDFIINDLELDIKTIPKPHLQQILIPKDQPPKAYYIGLKLDWIDGKVIGGTVLGMVDRKTATSQTFNHPLKKCEAWCVGEGEFNLNNFINFIILNK